MKIFFVASEGLPFSKSGGLGDVIGSLPYALAKTNEVAIVLPFYKKTKDNFIQEAIFVKDFTVYVNYAERFVGLWHLKHEGVDVYFIENDDYFYRSEMYGHFDDGEKFSFFQKAVLEMMGQLDYFPDIMHTHDWHTAMLPLMCKNIYKGKYQNIKQVYTIHNLKFQGQFDPIILGECLGIPYEYFNSGAVRYDSAVNFMKAGVLYSDKVTTVSPSYAKEILTDDYSEGLSYVLELRKRDLMGIVNGISLEEYDPATSTDIVKNYTIDNLRIGKEANKVALQEELGLKVDKDVMLISLISRLTDQKGIDLLIDNVQRLMEDEVQIVVLGNGDYKFETKLNHLKSRYKGRFAFYQGYNEILAKKIYASSDLFLMPSLFEPCGLSQLISMRFGTLPLVRETGGLIDTVTPYNKHTLEGNGFSFLNFNLEDLYQVYKIAHDIFYNEKDVWIRLAKQAMETDVSWDKSAEKYLEMYESLLS